MKLYVRAEELQHYTRDVSRLAATPKSSDLDEVRRRIENGRASKCDRMQDAVASMKWRFHLRMEPTTEFIKHWGGRRYEQLCAFLAMIQSNFGGQKY